MNDFITYREQNEKGNLLYYILQRAFPHYEAVLSIAPTNSALAECPIAGYHFFVVIQGTLRGKNVIPSYVDVQKEMRSVANQMAAWYLENRILVDEKKYRKWKIISHVSGSGQ